MFVQRTGLSADDPWAAHLAPGLPPRSCYWRPMKVKGHGKSFRGSDRVGRVTRELRSLPVPLGVVVVVVFIAVLSAFAQRSSSPGLVGVVAWGYLVGGRG